MIYLVTYRKDATQPFKLHTRTRNRFRALYWTVLLSAQWNEWNVQTIQRGVRRGKGTGQWQASK